MTTVQIVIAVLLVIGVLAYDLLKPAKFKRPPDFKREFEPLPLVKPSSEIPFPDCHQWEYDGEYAFPIVGESFYQDSLGQIAAAFADGEERECMATLILENSNPHDDKAVAVYLGRHKVGHLSRDDARSFRRRLTRSGMGGDTTCVMAKIFGGEAKRDGGAKSFGVWLEMKPFDN